MSYKSRFPITGRCTSTENAIKFFEMLPDSIPDEIKNDDFCDEYEAALNRFRFCADRLEPIAPVYHKGVKGPMHDYYTCAACGTGLPSSIYPDYCPNCGRNVKWDSTRCLTGCKRKDGTNGEA